MSPRGSESQREGSAARENDGPTGRQQEKYVPPEDRGESYGDPDVLLDVPSLSVEEIDLEVEDLRARVSFQAELADLVKINVGLDVELGRVKLQIKGVEAELKLKARLDNVRAIFSEVLETLQDDPQFFRNVPGTEYQPHEPAQEPAQRALGSGAHTKADGAAIGETNARLTEATNAAREKARELGVDLSTLEGTGSNGRITLRDVQEATRG